MRGDGNTDTSTNKNLTSKMIILNTKLNCLHNLRNPSKANHQNKLPQVTMTGSFINF